MAASRSRRASGSAFESIYGHGFVRVAVCTPRVEVASPSYNAAQTLALARQAAAEQAALALFPELGLSAYSNEDLFQQDALLDASLAALESLAEGSRDLGTLILAGLPLRVDDRLFNCAVALQRGRVLGVVPKTYLPNYREFYEKRQFAAAPQALSSSVGCSARTRRSAADCFLLRATSKVVCCTSRSARISGYRCRRARSPRWQAPRSSRICRRATSPSARRTIAG
jgi:hypothetical protein